jgi:hypothetical protein
MDCLSKGVIRPELEGRECHSAENQSSNEKSTKLNAEVVMFASVAL